jgi:putative ABC transport system permease protein
MIASKQFPRNRLFQVQGFQEVEAVTPVYITLASWRNPVDRSNSRNIFALGFDPVDAGFDGLLSDINRRQIQIPDQVVFDRLGRSEYGPVEQMLLDGETVSTEINDREFDVVGLYEVGTSFGLDGGVITSDLNFLRMFRSRNKAAIDLGLIQLQPGVNLAQVQQKIMAAIPGDVRLLSRQQFLDLEVEYWNKTTPIGYIFSFGAIMGLVVGVIIVYQILFADVQDHLQEYATLMAMGYSHSYLRNVVLQESVILAILGFLPGIGISILIFGQASDVTRLPLEMDIKSAGYIFALTLFMCAGSGLLALRKLRSVDPAEVF